MIVFNNLITLLTYIICIIQLLRDIILNGPFMNLIIMMKLIIMMTFLLMEPIIVVMQIANVIKSVGILKICVMK